jgi:hypothetical protein
MRRPYRKRQDLVFGMSRHDRILANWSNEINEIGPFPASITNRDCTRSPWNVKNPG